MKKVCAALLVVLFLLVSCKPIGSVPNAVSVISDFDQLTELTPGEVDEELVRKWNFVELNPYHGNACVVSLKDGRLCLTHSREKTSVHVMQGNTGYFVGVNMGVYDGWVKYYPYNSYYPEIRDTEVLVINEHCVGFLPIDNDNGYLFTSDNRDTTAFGKLYRLKLNETDRNWEWTVLTEIPAIPIAFCFDESGKVIYTVTNNGLLRMDETGKTEEIPVPDLWEAMCPTSIVAYDGSFYIGMAMGVYRYQPGEGNWIWYPVDYAEHIAAVQ